MPDPHPRLLGILLLAGSVVFLSACTLSAGGGATSSGPTITSAELQSRAHMDTYEIVLQLRPAWVRGRGNPSFQNADAGFAVVYIDHGRFGLPDSLRQIDPTAIDEIRYMNPTEATTRFGTGHMGGAILVTTRTGR